MSDRLTWDLIVNDKSGSGFKSFHGSLDRAEKKTGVFGKIATGAFHAVGAGAVRGLGAAASAAVKWGVDGVKAAASYNALLRQSAAVIKSTGNQAHLSVAGMKELAGSLENMSGVDEELILNSENVLATFTNIKNVGKDRIFDMAEKSTLDMSVALKEDLQGASIQVGKALNDPIKGITALTRVGVTFTQEQKDVIKHLVDTGKTADAQKVILQELNKEFGGSAKAAGQDFDGAMARAQDAISDVGRDLGQLLLPKLTEAGTWLSDKIPVAVQEFKDGWKGINSSTDIGALAESLHGLSDSINEMTDSLGNAKENGFVSFAKGSIHALTTLSDGMDLFAANWRIITNTISKWNQEVAVNWQRMIANIAEAGAKLPGPMGRHFKRIADQARKSAGDMQKSLDKTNTKIAEARLDALQIHLRHLSHEKATPKVNADIAAAQAKIGRITAQLRGIRDKYVNVFISEVNRDRATAGRSGGVAGRAGGGAMLAGVPYVTSENGPEIIVPLQDSFAIDADMTAAGFPEGGVAHHRKRKGIDWGKAVAHRAKRRKVPAKPVPGPRLPGWSEHHNVHRPDEWTSGGYRIIGPGHDIDVETPGGAAGGSGGGGGGSGGGASSGGVTINVYVGTTLATRGEIRRAVLDAFAHAPAGSTGGFKPAIQPGNKVRRRNPLPSGSIGHR